MTQPTTDLYVNIEVVQEMARQLEAVGDSLDRGTLSFEPDSGGLGSQRIAEVVQGFTFTWNHGHRELVDSIRSLLDGIVSAIAAYLRQEEELSRAAGKGPK